MGLRNRRPGFHEDVCACVALAVLAAATDVAPVTRPMMELRARVDGECSARWEEVRR